MTAEGALIAAAGTAVDRAVKVKLPSAVSVLLMLAGGVLLAVGYLGPGELGFKTPAFAGPSQQGGGGGGGGSGGAG